MKFRLACNHIYFLIFNQNMARIDWSNHAILEIVQSFSKNLARKQHHCHCVSLPSAPFDSTKHGTLHFRTAEVNIHLLVLDWIKRRDTVIG